MFEPGFHNFVVCSNIRLCTSRLMCVHAPYEGSVSIWAEIPDFIESES